MMPSIRHYLFALCCALPMAAQQAQVFITIDLPQGQQLRMIPLLVSDTPNIFSSRELKVGSGEFHGEPLSSVRLSGTVYCQEKWYLPFSETELTRAQYAAVMGLPRPSAKEAELPQTKLSMTEVQKFLAKLNALLPDNESYRKSVAPYCNEKTGMPFFRLPTAIEWEFAARGGNEVNEITFDEKTPYTEESIGKHEVCFAGKALSAPRPVKGGRQPNPLGLYDMLGNVSEWVSPIYYFDTQQGRSGGLLACGGNFRTAKQALHSSERMECRPYNEDGSEFRSEMIGVRLVLGSVIRHKDMSFENFQQEWDYFNNELRMPAKQVATANSEQMMADAQRRFREEQEKLTAKIALLNEDLCIARESLTMKGRENADLAEQLDTLEKLCRELEPQGGIGGGISSMGCSMAEARNVLKNAQRTSAETAVMIISTSCVRVHHSLAKIAATEKRQQIFQDDEAQQKMLRSQADELAKDIKIDERLLEKGCRLFAQLPTQIAEEAAALKLKELQTKNPQQYQALLIGLACARTFRSEDRTTAQREIEKLEQQLKTMKSGMEKTDKAQ